MLKKDRISISKNDMSTNFLIKSQIVYSVFFHYI